MITHDRKLFFVFFYIDVPVVSIESSGRNQIILVWALKKESSVIVINKFPYIAKNTKIRSVHDCLHDDCIVLSTPPFFNHGYHDSFHTNVTLLIVQR